MNDRSGIYEIVNRINGKRYIGSAASFRRRFDVHRYSLRAGKHHSVALQRAWNKYGEAAFVCQPLLICARSDLLMYEQRLIDGLAPDYNVSPTAGSSRGRKTSAETKKKLEIAILGLKRSAETRLRMSAAAKARTDGWLVSAQTRQKMSAARKGCKLSPRTEAHRRNLAASRRLFSEKQIRAMRTQVSDGTKQADVARRFKCSAATVCNVVAGKSYSWVM